MHLIPLHAPEDQSPPFVIGKHAEEPLCVSYEKGEGATEERNKEGTNIITFPRDEGVCRNKVSLPSRLWLLILLSLMGESILWYHYILLYLMLQLPI